MQIHLDVIARAAGILADQPGGIGFIDCCLKALRLVIEFAADIDVDGGASHAGTGEHAAFEQFMRFVAEDVTVLAGAGLAFIGIDDEVAWPVALFRHKRPFEAGRKTGTASAAKT